MLKQQFKELHTEVTTHMQATIPKPELIAFFELESGAPSAQIYDFELIPKSSW